MNIFEHIRDQILELLSLYPKDGLQRITVEPPRDATHGDISTNAAMVLAKIANKNPRELSSDFQKLFRQIDCVEDISVAGPGFINFTLKKDFLQNQIGIINEAGLEYGLSNIGLEEKINVEYVSVNPTGPLHIGHARVAVFGDVLASLLEKTGYDVTREYYVNDAGGQVDVLAKSAFLRYQGAAEIPAGMYPGEYLIPVAEEMRRVLGNDLTEKNLPEIRKFAVEAMLKLIRANLAAASIEQDIFTSEAEITAAGYVDKALKLLTEKGLIYQGVLEAPKGEKSDDWEAREQTLFKSSEFGDDTDRALKKADGSYTYLAGDLGYHLNKIERGFTKLVNVWGIDHTGYVKRMKAGVSALSDRKVSCEIKLCALVKLVENGEAVKMSKRAGNFIFIEDVIEKVGIDALRFIMLTRKNDIPLDFDLVKVLEQNKDNPVFYVQYAHARCYSAMRQADNISIDGADFSLLQTPAELQLIRKLTEYPRMIEAAAISYEPHRIAFYLEQLAAEFHALWNLGNNDKSLRFITADANLTKSRLALVKAVANVIASGLQIMGVSAPEEMK